MAASPRTLHDACERGDLAMVADEIDKGVDVNDNGTVRCAVRLNWVGLCIR